MRTCLGLRRCPSTLEMFTLNQRTPDPVYAPLHTTTHLQIYAACFGCQLMAQALGGEVRKNPSGRFVLGSEEIVGNTALPKHPFFNKKDIPLTFRLLGMSAAVTNLPISRESRRLCCSPPKERRRAAPRLV